MPGQLRVIAAALNVVAVGSPAVPLVEGVLPRARR